MTKTEAYEALDLLPPEEYPGPGKSTKMLIEALVALKNCDCDQAHIKATPNHVMRELVNRARAWANHVGVDPRRIREMCAKRLYHLRTSELNEIHKVFYDHTYRGPREED